MLIIRKANHTDRKYGWSYDVRQLQKICHAVEKTTGESISLEVANDFLSYLEQNFAIHPLVYPEVKTTHPSSD